jgi:hypothetical protein
MSLSPVNERLAVSLGNIGGVTCTRAYYATRAYYTVVEVCITDIESESRVGDQAWKNIKTVRTTY